MNVNHNWDESITLWNQVTSVSDTGNQFEHLFENELNTSGATLIVAG